MPDYCDPFEPATARNHIDAPAANEPTDHGEDPPPVDGGPTPEELDAFLAVAPTR